MLVAGSEGKPGGANSVPKRSSSTYSPVCPRSLEASVQTEIGSFCVKKAVTLDGDAM